MDFVESGCPFHDDQFYYSFVTKMIGLGCYNYSERFIIIYYCNNHFTTIKGHLTQ